MNGRLGRPYRFFYSSKNYVSGLGDIIAQVKKPNGSFHGNYTLTEFVGGLFDGTYYFDIPSTQNDPEGEYVLAIVEQSSMIKTVQKVTLDLNTSDGSIGGIEEVELYGKLYLETITGKIIKNDPIVGIFFDDSIVAMLSDSKLTGFLISNELKYKIKEEYILGKISECI